MSKQLLSTYVFAPGAAGVGTIRVPGRWTLNQITLITNVTRNVIIYNFADATYVNTSATFTRANDATNFPTVLQTSEGFTTITLGYSTVGQLAGDSLQIFVERPEMITRPFAFGTDSIERMRVSNPRSMIDADFEYGLQPTKWAGYGTMRGYPSVYEFPGVDLTISTITTDFTTTSASNSLITVTTTAVHGLLAGQAVNITSLNPATFGFSRADGNFIIYDVPTTSQIRYFANGTVGTASGQSLLTDTTLLKRGNLYTGAALATTTASGNAPANPTTITVNFSSNHGLVPNCPIYVSMSGGTNPLNATGQFIVASVPSLTSITFVARAGLAVTPGTPTVYALTNSSVTHRPFDGGVILTCKTPTFGASVVRVSKKYFRYQSGKGLLWSTGTMFKPSYDIQTLTASATGTSSTVTCKVDDIDHGLQIGASVTLSGVLTSGYNGTFTVASIVDDYTFTFNSGANNIAATTAVMDITAKVGLNSWHGAIVRSGCFDDQNGMFWEFDGQRLNIVRRNATQQLTGTIAINSNSNAVTGTNTRFTQQVRAGDKVVIRGMTHYVTSVTSNTAMTVTPDYRGVTNLTGVKASLVQETRVTQSQFNIDKLDGTGPSGFLFDAGKMQMVGIQYTWYGAGFIDYMVRGGDGNWVFAHRIKNNNINTEAHMRTGNLPVRYSVDNDGSPATSYLTVDPGSGGTTLTVNDNTYFPTAGTLYIDNELISYTGKGGTTTFTGCTRAATLTQWVQGSVRSGTAGAAAAHAVGTGVVLVSNTATPTLSHWGSALICDGGFDEDRGYIFNYQRTGLAIGTTAVTAFLIRLAPSVSNAAVGDLGSKELLNRSQLLLNSVGIQIYGAAVGAGQGSVIVEGVLNPKNFGSATWQTLNLESQGGQPSLAQVATTVTWSPASPAFAVPGEQVFAFAATPNSDDRLDLTALKELTNSPFGGVGAYPNGPDILAINVRTVVGTSTASVLLRWGEAQA
jgi:hypothetical protein